MILLNWFFDNLVFFATFATLITLALIGFGVANAASNRDQSFDSAYETWCKNNPTPVPVNTWRDDFGAWKNNEITLDEFLDRRWDFRQSK